MIENQLHYFIPQRFEYLTKVKKIEYDGVNLKTAFLINIIHELILKHYFTEDVELAVFKDNSFNLWSLILRKKYGMHYSKYINYLIEKEFISLVSDYYVNKKSKTYKINNFDPNTIKQCVVYDTTLIKKSSREYIENSISNHMNSPIDEKMRKRLVDDIYSVEIDANKSFDFLNWMKKNNTIDNEKYYKNYNSIEGIKNNNLFFKFDDYGRFHTNFTILKKEIRRRYLKIDGDDIMEIDIKNSQPLFLASILSQEMDPNDNEIKKFIELAKEGLFYDYFVDKFPGTNRKDIKLLIYKVLFGRNGLKTIQNKRFQEVFPKIYEYILECKKMNEDYRYLSHRLQRMESDFIFGKVIKEIWEKYPHIKLFTVHDSINFPMKYKRQVEEIFIDNLKKLF